MSEAPRSPAAVPVQSEDPSPRERARNADPAHNPRQAVRRQSPFYALTFRNFRLFFIGQIISVAGTWMQMAAQQWLVWDLTHSKRWLGIISGASAIPYVLFSFWGGQAADRFPRRAILVWTQTAAMGLAFLQAFLAWGRWIPIQAWHIAVLAGFSGIVNAYNMPAQQAFVTEMVDDRDALANAIALNSLRFNLARFVGPMLAGIVLVHLNAAACFALNGLSFIAVILSLRLMRLAEKIAKQSGGSIWEGFRYICEAHSVLRIVTLVGFGSLFAWSASTLYPAFASEKFRAGAGGFSTLMSVNGVGAALGAFALALIADRIPRRTLVYGGAIVFGLALLLFAQAPFYGLALFALVLSGFSMILFAISANTRVQEEVPDALRGRVMAVYSLVFNGLSPVGGLEIGFLAQRINISNAVALNALIFLVAAVSLLAWSLTERRRLPAPARS